MREPRETVNLAELYDEPPMPWERAADALQGGLRKAQTACFLGTVRPDGRPHSAAVGACQVGDSLYFTSGPGTRKARNLAGNPACTLSVRLEGIDVVFEGRAERVTDPAALEAVAQEYREGGWPAQVDGDALTAEYSAQSAGPPPWHVFRIDVTTAFGVALRQPYGASRWRF